MRRFQLRFFSSSTASSPVINLVNAHSLPSETAAYISSKLKISGICSFNKLNPDRLKLQKCDSLFNLLKDYGFTGFQIAEIIQKRPFLLGTKIESLEVKLKLLSERFGSNGRSLSSLILSDPTVLMLVKQGGPDANVSINRLVDLYGLPLETANSVFDKFSLHREKQRNFDKVLELFKGNGFSGIQIARLFAKQPSFLKIKVDTLLPKFKFLKEKGYTEEKLTDLIESNPAILNRGLMSQMDAWDILKKCFGTDDDVVEVVKRATRFLTVDVKKTVEPNIMMLREEGVPMSSILKLVKLQPWAVLEKPQRMKYAIKAVKELGHQPSSLMFIHSLRPVISVDEDAWSTKMELFKNLGWTDEEIRHMLLHYPLCFSTSSEKIKAVWDFFLNEAKYDRSVVVSYPKYLMYGLDKRVRPRFNVLKILKSFSLVDEKIKFSYVVNVSEKVFTEKYILPFAGNVPQLMDAYQGSVSSSNTKLL